MIQKTYLNMFTVCLRIFISFYCVWSCEMGALYVVRAIYRMMWLTNHSSYSVGKSPRLHYYVTTWAVRVCEVGIEISGTRIRIWDVHEVSIALWDFMIDNSCPKLCLPFLSLIRTHKQDELMSPYEPTKSNYILFQKIVAHDKFSILSKTI